VSNNLFGQLLNAKSPTGSKNPFRFFSRSWGVFGLSNNLSLVGVFSFWTGNYPGFGLGRGWRGGVEGWIAVAPPSHQAQAFALLLAIACGWNGRHYALS